MKHVFDKAVAHFKVGIIFFLIASSYNVSRAADSSRINIYMECYDKLQKLLAENGSFKEAVFITENEYFNDSLSKDFFLNRIAFDKEAILLDSKSNFTDKYRRLDSSNYLLNYSILRFFSNESFIKYKDKIVIHYPLEYSFTDPLGKQDWSNMFVTKLLSIHKGNCHSLAYLYKILADEVGAKCWLSLAPNHIYIRNYSDKIGWYNTELTSGTFPTDAWVMVTGYVSPEAIRSGLYMDTLSNQQSIALCVLDLAKEYEFQTHNYYDGFMLKCCDLALQYHPVNPMALLFKAETLKKVYLKEREEKYPKPTTTFNEMQNAYITLVKLGYREMPDKMYQQWLKTMTTEKYKYRNKKVSSAMERK